MDRVPKLNTNYKLYYIQSNMPPKRNTGRKYNVMSDELGFKKTDGGLYCILPFALLKESPTMKGENRRACFKMGMTTSFMKRIDNYHTSFPQGMHVFATLEDPPIPAGTRTRPKKTRTQHLLIVEKFLFQRLIQLGAERIYSTARVRELGVDPGAGGVTEYFYCSLDQMNEAFTSTWQKFGGDLTVYKADEPGKDFNKENMDKMGHAMYKGLVPFI